MDVASDGAGDEALTVFLQSPDHCSRCASMPIHAPALCIKKLSRHLLLRYGQGSQAQDRQLLCLGGLCGRARKMTFQWRLKVVCKHGVKSETVMEKRTPHLKANRSSRLNQSYP
jgi:hypothetical protein